MKTLTLLIALTALAAGLYDPIAAADSSGNAPADKYFGRLKYSALRIRFTTQQLKTKLESHQQQPGDVAHMAAFTEEAFFAWAARYPRDRWIPSSGYGLAKLYEELPGADARLQAIKLLQFVGTKYPKSSFARSSASALARGIPQRPFPAWAASPVATATAGPSAAPSLTTPLPSPSPSR